jgi:uncharacterized protein (TIGR03086 family)
MTQAAPAAWPGEAARLLEPSISYALGAVLAVRPELLPRPTPCRGWDLRMLLRHASESLAVLGEGLQAGHIGLDPGAEDGDLAADPARVFHDRACQLLDAWATPGHQRRIVEIAGCPLAASVMAATAALEVAVHGWDISGVLATGLLVVAPVLVPGTGRHPLFAAPLAVAATATPSDRLAAYLGRTPRA